VLGLLAVFDHPGRILYSTTVIFSLEAHPGSVTSIIGGSWLDIHRLRQGLLCSCKILLLPEQTCLQAKEIGIHVLARCFNSTVNGAQSLGRAVQLLQDVGPHAKKGRIARSEVAGTICELKGLLVVCL